jgi:hypothetical protein
VKTALAGAGFAESNNWGVQSPPPFPGDTASCPHGRGCHRLALSVKLMRTSRVVGGVTIAVTNRTQVARVQGPRTVMTPRAGAMLTGCSTNSSNMLV